MKIRQGFVSNSSSSSFVVALPENPKEYSYPGKVLRSLFPSTGQKTLSEILENEDLIDTGFSLPLHKSVIAYIVWKDIKNNGPATPEKILETAICSSFMWEEAEKEMTEVSPRWDESNREESKKKMDRYYERRDNIQDKLAEKEVKKFLKGNEGCYFYLFEYEDNGSVVGCTLEHGDIFRNVPYLRFNNH